MRVLMLGWDFSPRLSGGVGSACQGIANALARAPEPLTTEVLFVLPRLRGDEEPEKVRLLASDGRRLEPGSAPSAPSAPPPPAPRPEPPQEQVAREPDAEPEPARTESSTLPSPAEALRLLAIDSPLRPYLSPADYATRVADLLARIRAPARARETAASRRAPVAARTAPLRAAVARPRREPPPPAPVAEPAAVPPYGRALSAEVERYAREVLAATQGEDFDVIHAHDWMTFPAGMLLRERTGKPLVVHLHSTEGERRPGAPAPEARAIEQAAIEVAERVVCVSEAGARALRAAYAVEAARLRVVHDAFTPLGERPAEAARRAGPVVLYLGRLSEQKSPETFLRAAVPVLSRHPEARFVLAGEGELYPDLVKLARELGLGRRVRFTGFVSRDELAATYAAADVYVLSSAAEPFGISALEALSLGVPTVVPRGAGMTEVVRSVLRFAPLDAEDLADKVLALIERPALRAQLSAAGLREVRKLRWDRPARSLRAIYDEVARGPDPGA